MATISPNEYAPDEAATYNFANLDPVTLSPGESLDTDDAELVKAAIEHPWLDVDGSVEPAPVDEPENEADPADVFDNSGFFAAGDDA